MARIEDYAIIGDLNTAALVGRSGSIDWMCLPRFDSPACFAALLHTPPTPAAGCWRPPEQRTAATAPDANTVRTPSSWKRNGKLTADPCGSSISCPSATTPWIWCGSSKECRARSPCRWNWSCALITAGWCRGSVMASTASARWPAPPTAPTSPPPRSPGGRDKRTFSEFTVRAGERVPFVLRWAPSHEREPRRINPMHALEATESFWLEWIGRSEMTGKYKEPVERSLITLKALTYAPTGGIVAAATTSLPEQIGGPPRNWDYRYCWLRDATLTLQSLLAAGYTEEAAAWRDWLLRAIAGDPSELQIVYGLDGARRLPEADIPWLSGYEGSLPVRTGNAAAPPQLQLDVWGRSPGRAFADQGGIPPGWQCG